MSIIQLAKTGCLEEISLGLPCRFERVGRAASRIIFNARGIGTSCRFISAENAGRTGLRKLLPLYSPAIYFVDSIPETFYPS